MAERAVWVSEERNTGHKPDAVWDACKHDWWYPTDSMSEGAVECKICGCPGEINDGNVYWPTT